MCFAPLLHFFPILEKRKNKGTLRKKKTFHLLIRWSHQQSIEMRLSLLRHIEWPTKEHRGSKSKESLIWSCEWQYWFAFAFLTGWNSESEPKVMETITVTTCCLSCLPSVLHSALRLYRYQVLLFFSFFFSTIIFWGLIWEMSKLMLHKDMPKRPQCFF